MRRFLLVGTRAGGLLISILNWFAAAVLPPRYKQFRNPRAVVETVRSNVSSNDIYAVPQGLFVAVSLHDSSIPANFGSRIMGQFLVEFLVAFGLSVLLSTTSIQSPLPAATFLGLTGLIAGIETHFPNWNWSDFPTSYLLAGTGYLAVIWFLAGLVLGIIRRKLVSFSPTANR